MNREVVLASRTHGAIRHGNCVLCRLPYEAVRHGTLLLDGAVPRGEVCLACLEAGPGEAARNLRQRAARSRRLAECCRPSLEAWRWSGLVRLLHEHATALEALADRLARLPGWAFVSRFPA